MCVCARAPARPRARVLQIHAYCAFIHINLEQDCSLFVCEALAHDSECLRKLVLIDATYARSSQTCGLAHHRPQRGHLMSEHTHAPVHTRAHLQARACMQTHTHIAHARRDRRTRARIHVHTFTQCTAAVCVKLGEGLVNGSPQIVRRQAREERRHDPAHHRECHKRHGTDDQSQQPLIASRRETVAEPPRVWRQVLLFLQEQIKGIIIITCRQARSGVSRKCMLSCLTCQPLPWS